MHPPSHLILSWLVGHRLPDRRDRRLVAWAGPAPDWDGLTILGGSEAYDQWHVNDAKCCLVRADVNDATN
jgi:hypothetical protein